MSTYYYLKSDRGIKIKNEATFKKEGGLTSIWGILWEKIIADSMKDALEKIGVPK